MFSIVTKPIYISTNSEQEFPLLHILSHICCLRSFDDSHSDRSEAIPHCGFNWYFSELNDGSRRSNQSILKEISPGCSLEE